MPPNYNPELNTTELCKYADKYQYWKCIGEMQWSLALFRIDTMYANVVLS